jgi:hypothetical protein
VEDERAGYGREVRENGDVYEGQFVRDKRHGRGRFLSVRGEEYDGGWADGKRDGQVQRGAPLTRTLTRPSWQSVAAHALAVNVCSCTVAAVSLLSWLGCIAHAHVLLSCQGVSIVLPIDEAERQRQRVSASLLVYRERHFLNLTGAQAQGRA